MKNIFRGGSLILIILLIEFLAFYAIQSILKDVNKKYKLPIYVTYFIVSIGMIVLLFFLQQINLSTWHPTIKSLIIASLLGFFVAKLIIAIFSILNFIYIGIQWIIQLFSKHKTTSTNQEVKLHEVSRSRFLSYAGVGIGTLLFGTFINGIRNKYKYELKKATIPVKDLPEALQSLKIIQISDVHCGSFDNPEEVKKGFDLIMAQQPDLIVFTGDLVNNTADEIEPYKDILSSLKAPLGVYSILGNHDYGDYVRWDSEEARTKNLNKLKDLQKEMGWQLLNNESVELEYQGSKFNLIGVENWSSKGNFPKYGDLNEAIKGVNINAPLSILLSHDPSHWDAEIRTKAPFINLTLSGHTHGMQFGVRLPFMQWSPVQFMYKQWAGLYTKQHQHLYVNVGFGFLAYPGRVGIMPEITAFSFEKA